MSTERHWTTDLGCRWLAVALLAAIWGGPTAQAGEYESYSRLIPVSEAELREMRGGFTVMGVEFSFGAVHKVVLDGGEIARTVFTVANDGTLSSQLTIPTGSPAVQFNGSNSPSGINPGSFDRFPGVVVPGNNGGSVALAGVDAGAFGNAVLNTEPGRNIAGQFNVELVIHEFSSLNSQATVAMTAARLANALQSGIDF